MLVYELDVAGIVIDDDVEDAQHHADEHAQEGQATDTRRPASNLLEDDAE